MHHMTIMLQVHPTLELIEDVMADLHQAVDSRVYIAVGRGLWDCASQDVYDYLEGLQEGLGLNKVQPLQPALFMFAGCEYGQQTESFILFRAVALCTADCASSRVHHVCMCNECGFCSIGTLVLVYMHTSKLSRR